MRCTKILVLFAMVMALAMTISATSTKQEAFLDNKEDGFSRFLAPNYRGKMTCDKYPRVCHFQGSPGPDCCKKICVDVLTDRLNCGKCGKKCRYSEICCEGECVSPWSNEKHCGSCNNNCEKGSSCFYGMCSYA